MPRKLNRRKASSSSSFRNTSGQPLLGSLQNRPFRERHAGIARAQHKGGEWDTRNIVMRTAQLRAEKAKLLGYEIGRRTNSKTRQRTMCRP